MTYVQDLEKQFRAILSSGDVEAIVTFFKNKLQQSFRNGIKEGKKSGIQPEPAAKS